ncbi:CRIB domain-containing protein RIC7-like, partial [Trifolium pratense]
DEKEDEIQIGFPTDVKHVAHIGSDDPSANAPSWMNEYKSANPSGGAVEDTETAEGKSKSSNPKEKPSKHRHIIPKSRHQSIDQESNPTAKKTTRRHNRSSDPSADSSAQDSSTGGSRHRRHRRGSNHGSDSVPADIPTDTKPHRRRSKNSEDGSVRERSSRRSSKGDSLTDISITDFGSDSVPESGNEPKYC